MYVQKQVLCQTPLYQLKHQKSSSQTLKETFGNDIVFDDTHGDDGNKSVRCNCGLCDFHDIMFSIKPDL